MYIYLSSQQSLDPYPLNTATNFTVDLRQPLFLDNPQEWEIALVDAEVPFFVKPSEVDATNFFILCDIVDYSLVGGFTAQVLRRIPVPAEQAAAATILTGTVIQVLPPRTSNLNIVSAQAVPATTASYVFDPPYYLPCIKGFIENIRITVKSLSLESLTSTTEPMFLTLELRKRLINTEYAQY